MQALKIETYDRVLVREDGRLMEVDCRITSDDRIIIKRGLDSAEFGEVRREVLEQTGQLIAPILWDVPGPDQCRF